MPVTPGNPAATTTYISVVAAFARAVSWLTWSSGIHRICCRGSAAAAVRTACATDYGAFIRSFSCRSKSLSRTYFAETILAKSSTTANPETIKASAQEVSAHGRVLRDHDAERV